MKTIEYPFLCDQTLPNNTLNFVKFESFLELKTVKTRFECRKQLRIDKIQRIITPQLLVVEKWNFDCFTS